MSYNGVAVCHAFNPYLLFDSDSAKNLCEKCDCESQCFSSACKHTETDITYHCIVCVCLYWPVNDSKLKF